MAHPKFRTLGLCLLLFALACLVGACSKPGTPLREPNTPETVLTYAPLEGDTSSFQLHLYWSGFDRDGEVVRYRYAIDSDTTEAATKWSTTTATDTTLVFQVDPVEAIRGHVFWISSEDNDGYIDPTPAKRFFSARTIPPTSTIVRGPSPWNSIIGPNFAFEWQGIDPDGSPTGDSAPCESSQTLVLRLGATNDTIASSGHEPLPPYNQLFYTNLIRASTGDALADPRYDDWHWSEKVGTSLRVTGARAGEYVFAERAVDPAGARETNLSFIKNIRHFTVATRNVGPALFLSFEGGALPSATGPIDFARPEIHVLEGDIISFAWSASAESYGGSVVGFTYALDDTIALPPFDIRNTAVTVRTAEIGAGLHFLFIRVVDDGGLQTHAVIPFRVIHPTFKDPVSALNPPQYIYVDDALSPGESIQRFFNYPSDAEEDAWWNANILAPLSLQYGVGRRDWDTALEGNQNGGGLRMAPSLVDLALYRAVIWNVDFAGNRTALWQALVGDGPRELRTYLRGGGTLILSGFGIATDIVRPTTALTGNFSRGICAAFLPGTAEYSQTFFPREMLGINGARGTEEALRRQGHADFLSARTTTEGAVMGYVTADVDTGITAKWYGKIFPGTPESSWTPGLPLIQGWRMAPFFNCEPNQALLRREDFAAPISTPIFTYHGAPKGIYMDGGPSPREDLVVGVQVQAHDLGEMGGGVFGPGNSEGATGRIVAFGFPMYFLKDAEATSLMRTAFGYVNSSPTLPPSP